MKMRKSTWLLLVLALAAILLVAGCEPTTPAPTPPENGEEPTPPPTDKECPKVVKTEVAKAYITGEGYGFKLTITFNEAITSSCVEDLTKWTITVKNSDREDDELTIVDENITIKDISVSDDGKKVYVKAKVTEPLTYSFKAVVAEAVYETVSADKVEWKLKNCVVADELGNACYAMTYYGKVSKNFEGLICSEDDAERYAELTKEDIAGAFDGLDEDDILDFEIIEGPGTPKSADTVEWKLKDCVVADELGNACCDYSGSACCLEPTCAECEAPCILGSEGSCL